MRTYPIGFLFSCSGSYGVVGRSMLNGATLALEAINAARTGLALRPLIADPAGDITAYVTACNTMLDSGVRHVVGCYTSSSRKELIPVFEKRDAVLWYPSHYEGFESASNVVYTGAAPNQHIVPLIDHAVSDDLRRVFCIGSNYIWAWENNRILRDILLARGGEVLGERYFAVGEEGFDQVIASILAAKPDAVFNTLIGSSSYRFLGALRAACVARGIDQAREMPVLSCTLCEPELAEIAPEARDGHISSGVYFADIDSDANRRFTAAYRARFPAGPAVSADAETAYVAVHLLALSLAAAGTDEIGAVLREAARQVLDAPDGSVRLDPRTMHAVLTPRIARSRSDGGFDILHAANTPLAPDPYLIRSAPRYAPLSKPKLRLVS